MDQGYPLKSTILYLAVPGLVDILTLAKAHAVDMPAMTVFCAGGVLICVPWGIPGAILCMGLGAAVGGFVGVVLKYLLHRFQARVARILAASRADLEMALVLVWAAAAVAVFHMADWLMFPGVAGAIAAANVLLGRALILPELNDLYWLAARIQREAAETLAVGEKAA